MLSLKMCHRRHHVGFGAARGYMRLWRFVVLFPVSLCRFGPALILLSTQSRVWPSFEVPPPLPFASSLSFFLVPQPPKSENPHGTDGGTDGLAAPQTPSTNKRCFFLSLVKVQTEAAFGRGHREHKSTAFAEGFNFGPSWQLLL